MRFHHGGHQKFFAFFPSLFFPWLLLIDWTCSSQNMPRDSRLARSITLGLAVPASQPRSSSGTISWHDPGPSLHEGENALLVERICGRAAWTEAPGHKPKSFITYLSVRAPRHPLDRSLWNIIHFTLFPVLSFLHGRIHLCCWTAYM